MYNIFRYPIINKDSPFGSFSSNVPVLMDDLQCFGTETDIAACHFRGWGNSDCTYRESISITCGKYAIQLNLDLK